MPKKITITLKFDTEEYKKWREEPVKEGKLSFPNKTITNFVKDILTFKSKEARRKSDSRFL